MSLADDGRAFVVLQSARNDFAGAGRVLIDQYDQWKLGVIGIRLGDGDGRRIAGLAIGAGADDHAVIEELVHHVGGRSQQAAGVVAQVHDQAADVLELHGVQGAYSVPGPCRR